MSDFEAELQELDDAARIQLPKLVSTYDTMSSQISSATKAIDANVAADPAMFPNHGQFGTSWSNLRDQITAMLDTSSKNAAQIGTGLTHVTQTYAATDAQVAADLSRLSGGR